MSAWKTWFAAASLTLGLSPMALEASANPAPHQESPQTRNSSARLAGYDVGYYRAIGEQCGALTEEQRKAQLTLANDRVASVRDEAARNPNYWDAFDQGKLEAFRDAAAEEGELCTCSNMNHSYNDSLACGRD